MEEKDMRLEAAVEYNFDELEVLAYQCGFHWLDALKRFFPNLIHTGFRKGDPRKSLLFKYCYKLVRETRTILPPEELPLYIRSQLDILRHITRGQEHPEISPNCLVGDKAWIRWKLWKRKYDERTKVIEDKNPVPANQIKVVEALNRTREFLAKSFGAEICAEKLQEAVLNKNLQRWVALGKISPYYLVLSPLVKKAFPDGVEKLIPNLDLEIYRQIITPEIEAWFAKNFSTEK